MTRLVVRPQQIRRECTCAFAFNSALESIDGTMKAVRARDTTAVTLGVSAIEGWLQDIRESCEVDTGPVEESIEKVN